MVIMLVMCIGMVVRMHDVIVLMHRRMVVMLGRWMVVVHGPVMVVVDGMSAPIRVDHLPALETMESHRIANDPDIAGSQIIILVAHHTDVFVAVPGVVVRDWFRRDDYRRRRSRSRIHDNGWGRHHNGWPSEATIGYYGCKSHCHDHRQDILHTSFHICTPFTAGLDG